MHKFSNLSLRGALLGSAAVVATVLSSSGAMAQNCTSTPLRPGFLEIGGLVAGTASSVVGAIGNLNTAFLSQQSSAFVAAPSGVAPDTQGGGVWVRGIGGEVDVDSTTKTAAQATPVIDPAIDSGTIECNSTQRLTFSGVQVGRDISRLNLMGYNVHIGATAGYLESDAKEQQGTGTFETSFEVPFVGIYGVLTKDSFFADANLRFEYYNIDLNEPALSLFNQSVSGKGVSLTLGAGYHGRIGNGWFIEPSAGATLSRTEVDNFNGVGLPAPQLGNNLSGTFSIKPINSAISRLTLRVGRSFTAGNLALQPFATASFLREWAGDVKSSYVTCQNCVFVGNTPVTDTFTSSTSRVGGWGQYSLGIAGQVINTGWLGFVRGDYRNGEKIDGWTLNAGLRYQYTPEPQAVEFSKGPTVAMAAPVYWTGFYLGGNFGAGYGETDVGFTDRSTVDSTIAGWIGGGQVGYNYQFGAYVVGIEGDYGASNINGSETCGPANGLDSTGTPVAFSPFFMTCGSELDWIATAAARFGVTWDRALFYVKGGAAWTEESVVIDCIIGPFNVPGNARQCRNPAGALVNHLDVSDTRTGWMVGYGGEFSLTSNWSAKAEFKYMDFGSQDYTASDGSRLTSDLQVSTVTVGINYRFSPAPLVARY